MKNKTFKKSISLIMAVLMVMSCWVFFPGVVPTAEAALGNVEVHQGEVTGYVTVDPVIYVHGDNSSGDKYDYMNYGSVISDGSYDGEYKTAVSVSGKTIKSVNVTETGATLGISGGILTGNLGGSYGNETSFTTTSYATLKFTFTDETFEYHRVAVKPNPVDQHAIGLTLNSNTGRRRMVAFEILAYGSAGQATGGSSNGNSNWIYRYNFPSMYDPHNTSYTADNSSSTSPLIGGITSNQISANKVAGYAASERINAYRDSVSITVTSPTALYYLDLSSSKNLGVTHTAGGTDWAINLLVGNLAFGSNYYGTGVGYSSHSSTHTATFTNVVNDIKNSEAFSNGAEARATVKISGTQSSTGTVSGNFTYTGVHGPNSDYKATTVVTMPYQITVVNKAALRNRYNEIVAQKLQSGNYTMSSWNNFKNALLEAEVYLNNSTADTSNETTLLNNLNAYYSALKRRNYELSYDNLFVFSEWAASNCTNANATDRGTITYDIDNGTITAVDNSSNTTSNDLYTEYGIGTNYYKIPVEESTKYYLDFDVSESGGQCYIFYYSDSAAVNGSDGNPHRSLSAASGAKEITTPAGCTQLGVRFGSAVNGAAVTFSNIRFYEASKKDMIDEYKASGIPSRTAFNYGAALTADVVASPARAGYTTVGGWIIDADYSDLFTADEPLSNFYGGYSFNACWIVYSDWTEHTYNIAFDANGGSGSMSAINGVKYTAEQILTDNAFTRSGYTFTGWNTKADGSGTAIADGATVSKLTATNNETITLYAQWSINKYTVTFNYANGSSDSQQYDYGTTITVPANTTKDPDATNHYTYTWTPTVATTVSGNATYSESLTTTAHNWSEWSTTAEPTCTSTGTKTRSCNDCGYTETATVDKANHTLIHVEAKPATCTADGNIEYWYCDVCDKKFSDANASNEITDVVDPKKDHTPGTAVVEKEVAATCTVEGSHDEVVYCTVCKGEISRVTVKDPKLAHTEETIPAVEATCTAPGKTAGVKCSVCGEILTAQTEIPELGHDMGEWITDKEPTCITAGSKHRECANCGYSETDTIAATGEHEYGEWKDYTADEHSGKCINDVNCTEIKIEAHTKSDTVKIYNDMYHYYKCEKCDAYGDEYNGVFKKEVKEECYGEGTTYSQIADNDNQHIATCKCGNEKKVNHSWAGWVADPENTSDDQGKMTNTCNDCGYRKTTTCKYTAIETVNATCTVDGHKTWKCSECSNGYTEILKAPGHDYDSVVTDPTCTEKGYTTHTCSVCGDTYTDSEVAASGHDWADATYTFTADGKSCTAQRVCNSDSNHTEIETVEATGEITKPATCIAMGETTYTATFEADWATEQTTTKTDVAINPDNHDLKTTEKKDPTCTEIGWDEYVTCQREGCDYTTYVEKPATNHAYGAWTYDADGKHKRVCANDGTHIETEACADVDTDNDCLCDKCGNLVAHSYGDASCDAPATCTVCGATTGDKLGHDYTVFVKTVPFTCTEKGYDVYRCSRCEETENKNFTDAAHRPEADATVIEKATCEADGYKAVLCSECGAELSKETIEKRAHVYKDNGVAQKATCLAEGVMNTICTNEETDTHKACVHKSTRAIDKLDHSYTGDYKWNNYADKAKTHSQKCVNGCEEYGNETACDFDEVVTPATCYANGYTTYTCKVCKNSYQSDYTTREHVYVYATGNGTIHKVSCEYSDCDYADTENCSGGAATCTEKAICEKCNTAWGEKDAANHTGEANVIKNYKKETCSEEGYTGDTYWSCCDALEAKGEAVPKLPHTQATREENRIEASCGADGSYDLVTYCSVCGEVIGTEKKTIPATGAHNYVTETDRKEPTCQDKGYYVMACGCGETETYVLETVDHKYETYTANGDATCQKNETETASCVYGCGKTDTREIADSKVGHKYTTYTSDNNAKCEEDGTKTALCDYGCGTKNTVTDVGSKINHDWADTTYSFAADGSSCTAQRVCKNDAAHVETATATITSAVKTPATCEEDGWTTYTATFTEAWADEQKIDVRDIDAINHDWADTTYNFAADGSSCTAQRVCKNDAAHIETATATITSAVKTPAICEEDGWTTYTATFTEAWAATQNLDVQDIPAINHDYDTTKSESNLTRPALVDGVWTQGYYTYTCKNNANHTDIEYVDRASYTAYTAAWNNLESLLSTDITDEAKTAINKILADNDIADNLITSEQSFVDTAEENLKYAFDRYKGSLNTYTVTFVVEGVETKVEVISGNSALAPTYVKKAYDETYHYVFNKWDKDFTNVTSDLTVTAQFDAIAHTYTHTDKDDTYHTDKCDCGYSKDVKHTETSAVTTKASCTAAGVRTYTCTVCGGTRTETIAKREHNLVDTTVAQAPTCSATGIMNQKCNCAETAEYEACEYTTTRVMDKVADAHKWETEYTVDKKASCDEAGSKSYHCEYCDVINADSVVEIAKREHNLVDTTVAQAPTCSATGIMNQKCNCVETAEYEACEYTTTRVMDKVADAHKWETEYTVDKKASCDEAGSKSYHCEYCDAINADSVVEIAKREHNLVDTTVAQAPTCSATGIMNQKCDCAADDEYEACEYTTTRVMDKVADAHKWETEYTVDKKASCDEAGSKSYHCEYCDVINADSVVEIAKREHNLVDTTVALAPTCSATGIMNQKCNCAETAEYEACNYVTTRVIPAKGHTFGETTAANDATCTAPGNKAYKQCTVCNLYFAEDAAVNSAEGKNDTSSFVIKALDHNFATSFTVDKKATCEADGSKSKHCTRCGEKSEVTVIAKREHNLVDNGVASEATCLSDGTMNQKCSNASTDEYEACNYVTTRVIPAKGHTFGETTAANDATCTAPGNKAYKQCTVCNLYFAEDAQSNATGGVADTTSFIIPQKTHSYTGEFKWNNENGIMTHAQKCVNGCNEYGPETACEIESVVIAPTCMSDGYTAHTCKVCGNGYTADIIPAQGHDWTEWEHVEGTNTHKRICGNNQEHTEIVACVTTNRYVAPTCTKDGISEDTCAECNYKYEAKKISAHGHRYIDENGVENVVIVEPGCTTRGSKYKVCLLCGEKTDPVEFGQPTGHYLFIQEGYDATCTEDGRTVYKYCIRENCDYVEHAQIIKATGHKDDGSGNCQNCGNPLYDGGSKACSCLCHSDSAFIKFIYKIVLFFWKLFRIKGDCPCGAIHY